MRRRREWLDFMRFSRRGAGLTAGAVSLAIAAVVAPPAVARDGHRAVSAQPEVKTEHARVIRVVDGDTLKVQLQSGRRVYVRLLGIDTPEVFGGPVQCWGAEASGATGRMLPVDAKVVLTSDPSQALKDRYHRLLRYVSKGGVDVGRKLVLHGHAEVYVYHHEPFKRVESYRNAEDYAHVHDVGLWGSCKGTTPAPTRSADAARASASAAR